MRTLLISIAFSIAFSFSFVSYSAHGMDSCSDAFGAAPAGPGTDGRLKIRSENPSYQADAQATLQAVDQFLQPSGLLTPKMLKFDVSATASSVAQFQMTSAVIRMQTDFVGLSPLQAHAAFVHEYGHAIFEYSALRDSSKYRALIKAMSGYQKVLKTMQDLEARHLAAVEAPDFDLAFTLRKELKTAQASFDVYVNANMRDLKLWNYGGVFQEAFADLVPVLYFKDPEAFVKFDPNPLRNHSNPVSPDNWMEQNVHHALIPFVRHVVQRTLVQGDINSPDALKIVHQLLLLRIAQAQADSEFATQPKAKLAFVDKLKHEAYIYGYKISDLNRDLIADFDQALSARQ